ncbi:phage major tail tube protein [Azospirillum sp. Sh1]|uniref:phage major tail tube protein n=1 Tax=Azospirillum sp. Sh1 TaxID=2607285 RepID=UPI0011F062B7|nr:phage major tail tube protein [Azospirillum sp. Sh1]KAA0571063.1 phage major tail tube protein [Azospirillum sp. Sh1]
MAPPKVVKYWNLFIDGRGYAGRVDEVNEPKLSIKTDEHRGGGMDAPMGIDLGMDKIEFSFTLSEHSTEVYRQFGLIDGNAVRVQLRQSLADDTTLRPKVITAQGMLTELDGGSSKSGDKGSLKGTIWCRYYKLEIDGRAEIEIDIDNMKRVINGVDQLAQHRANIGL